MRVRDIAINDEQDGTTPPTPATVPFIQPGPKSSAELMGHLCALLSICSADKLSPKVLLAMACLEEESRIVWAVSAAQKAKSLVQRCSATAVDIGMPATGELDALAANEIIIERDTIVIV